MIFNTREGFSFHYPFRRAPPKQSTDIIVSDSHLYRFDKGELPVDVLAIKGARIRYDNWNIKDLLKTYDRVIFFLGGNDLTDHKNLDRNRTMRFRKAGTPDQVARELQLLAGAMKMAGISGIRLRAGMRCVLPKTNELIRQSKKNYVFVGPSKGLHRVNETKDGIHLSNWQLGNFKMTLGQRLPGWLKRSQQCATKIKQY